MILLHGWPGARSDYAMCPLLTDGADVIVPDLRGFGESDRHLDDPAITYSAVAQARSVLGLIDELGLQDPVIAGYDIGTASPKPSPAPRRKPLPRSSERR